MSILQDFKLALIEEDICPECLGLLRDDYKCKRCNYDAYELLVDEKYSTERDTPEKASSNPPSLSEEEQEAAYTLPKDYIQRLMAGYCANFGIDGKFSHWSPPKRKK